MSTSRPMSSPAKYRSSSVSSSLLLMIASISAPRATSVSIPARAASALPDPDSFGGKPAE